LSRPIKFHTILTEILKTELPSDRGGSTFFYDETLFLYIQGEPTPVNDSIDFFLRNDGAELDIPMYIQGQSPLGDTTGSGNIPYNETLFLFIGTPANPTADLKLFMKVIGGTPSGSLDFFMKGIIDTTGTLHLVMPNTLDLENNNIEFYTHGGA